MRNREDGRAGAAKPRREGQGDIDLLIEDGIAKPNEPVSSAVAEPKATTLRHEPHEPPRQHLPTKLFELADLSGFLTFIPSPQFSGTNPFWRNHLAIRRSP